MTTATTLIRARRPADTWDRVERRRAAPLVGRALATHLGYERARLDLVPGPAVDAFRGVGHHFGLTALAPGERVVDLGSGCGMDAFVAATYVGFRGHVFGVDMTERQRDQARRLRTAAGDVFDHVSFLEGNITRLPLPDGSVDCVTGNGVLNLVADKARAFAEAARVLRPGGRLAICELVAGHHLPAAVVGDVDLWEAGIGGALRREDYARAILDAGLTLEVFAPNRPNRFASAQAAEVAADLGLQSLSFRARKA